MRLPNRLVLKDEYGEKYFCEECRRYRRWEGPDWGASHFFCDECLAKLELEQARDETERLEIAESIARGLC